MPESPTAPSPDVQRLADEGYTVCIEGDYIIVDKVPYVSAPGTVSYGAIISAYKTHNGIAQVGNDHPVWFTGSVPCTPTGQSLANALVADTKRATVAGRQVLCRLSYKAERPGMLDNYYNKLTHYIRKLQGYANVIDPAASAIGNGSISIRQKRSVFYYPNMAIAREGLDAYEEKLKLPRIAIIGLGGTGSYILDALAKTPVQEIHLYDDDVIEPGTAYRMPGALTFEEAHQGMRKADYLRDLYGRMRAGIESHTMRIDQSNVHELDSCDFVFIAIDHGPSRGLIARHLADKGIAFIDVGMGVDRIADDVKLIARARVTSIGSETKSLVDRLPAADDQDDALYNNIQIAELNALNAMLAIILYKQKIGFYADEMKVGELRYILAWQRLTHSALEQA